jgi:hypothetical protein
LLSPLAQRGAGTHQPLLHGAFATIQDLGHLFGAETLGALQQHRRALIGRERAEPLIEFA